MKYHLKFTTAFKKAYKRCIKRGLNMDKLDFVMGELQAGNTLPEQYRDHQLSGKMSDFRGCHIQPDWLLVYKIKDDILTLTMVDTGSHADIFKM